MTKKVIANFEATVECDNAGNACTDASLTHDITIKKLEYTNK